MKRFGILAAAAAALVGLAQPAEAFRCGEGNRYLATEGMHKFQILKDCGPPASREVVGVDRQHGSYRDIEEWLYIIEDHGRQQMYLIKFDREGVAARIEWLGAQKN